VTDYGIRGMHLAYDLLGGVKALVLVDAVPPQPGNLPGDIRVLQIGPQDLDAGSPPGLGLDPHGMDPLTVLTRLRALGGTQPVTYVVGCVVADTEPGIGLSSAVEAAVPHAMAQVLSLAAKHIPAVPPELSRTELRR